MATATATATTTTNGDSHHGASTEQPFFPDEPLGPQIRTEIPGPKSKKAIEELDKVFDTRSLNMIANYQQSFGN